MSDEQKPFELPDTPPTLPTLAAPGPITSAAIEQAKNLPENTFTAGVTSTDFKTADARIEVQKKWSNGWGVGSFLSAKLGAGRPQGSAGVFVTKKLGLMGGVDGMNPMYKAMLASVIRTVLPFLAAKGIKLENAELDQLIDAAVLIGSIGWGVYQKFKVDRKLKKVAATGVLS